MVMVMVMVRSVPESQGGGMCLGRTMVTGHHRAQRDPGTLVLDP